MKVMLIYNGDGFEATRIVEMPALLQPGMDIGIVLDDGAGQPGTEWFPVHSVNYLLAQEIFILKLRTPLKYGHYKATSTPKLGARDFRNEDWKIRTNHEIRPFE